MAPRTEQPWETPSAEEIARKAGAVPGFLEDEPEAETSETDEPSGDEPQPDQKTEGDEADQPGGKAKAKSEDDGTFDLDGERVSRDQVKEWRSGYMRTQDYHDGKRSLAQERREMREQMNELLTQQRQILETYGRIGKPGEEPEPEEPLPPGVDKALKGITKQVEEIKGRWDETEQREQDEKDRTFIKQTFEGEITRLFNEHKVDKTLRTLYFRAILGMDPKAADETGQISAETIRSEAVRCFNELNRQVQSYQRTARTGAVDELRRTQPPKKPIVPVKTKPAEPEKPARKKRVDGWDSEDATKDFLDRANTMLSPSED